MNEKAPSQIVIQAWARLVRAANQTMDAVESDLKAAGFPPLGWYDVCLELSRAGEVGLRPLEIEDHLLLAQHNVSRLVDRMAKAGYVARKAHESDGRGLRIILTAKGHELLEAMWPHYRAAIERHVGSKLGGDDRATQLVELLAPLAGR